jgi:hypothetical protein
MKQREPAKEQPGGDKEKNTESKQKRNQEMNQQLRGKKQNKASKSEQKNEKQCMPGWIIRTTAPLGLRAQCMNRGRKARQAEIPCT